MILIILSIICSISLLISLFINNKLSKQIIKKNLEIAEKDIKIEVMKINLFQYHRKLDDYEHEHCLHPKE